MRKARGKGWRAIMKNLFGGLLVALVVGVLAPGCLSVKTEHEIKPIHITMDINLKVDRELNNFFGDIDEAK